ncbi:MAG: RHS repeat-associated core domain-containing protein, partial [Armatimonadetes bacterium]|nr:RHS repeat-associated core domain-containing protein [Armatimonadota bacterium]
IDGLRAWKTNSSGTTYFLYDGITPICEIDSTGAVSAVNTFGPTGLLSRHAGTSSIFYAFDPQGNPAEDVNSSDSVLASFDFDAFAARSISGTATDPYSGFGSQYGYYSDTETGLQLLGYRYYDPVQGRFVNRDPIGMAGGTIVYGYVGNDAARWVQQLCLVLTRSELGTIERKLGKAEEAPNPCVTTPGVKCAPKVWSRWLAAGSGRRRSSV